MPIRNLILSLLVIIAPKICFGQQDPQFSQYFFNQLFLNPAVANSETSPKVQLIHRSQYLGYSSNFDKGGSLNTQLLSFQMPIAKLNSGVGLIIVNDQAGLQKNQQFRLSYAKNFKSNLGALSIGASVGFYNKSFGNNFRPREGGDTNIPTDGISQIKPDFGIGINLSAKSYFASLGINHLNSPKFDYGAVNGKSTLKRAINAMIGLNIPINSKIELKPNLLLRTDLQNNVIEGGLLANIGTKYWIGANYRKEDAAILMAGVNLMKENALKLGIAYDIITAEKYIKSASSIEIMASYIIGKTSKDPKVPPKRPIIRTPRYRF